MVPFSFYCICVFPPLALPFFVVFASLSVTLTFLFVCASSFQVSRETNDELRAIEADPAEGFDVGAILSVARRYKLLIEGYLDCEDLKKLKCLIVDSTVDSQLKNSLVSLNNGSWLFVEI